MTEVVMDFNSEKKHSVRYDVRSKEESEMALTTVYIRKSSLPIPYPRSITITVKW